MQTKKPTNSRLKIVFSVTAIALIALMFWLIELQISPKYGDNPIELITALRVVIILSLILPIVIVMRQAYRVLAWAITTKQKGNETLGTRILLGIWKFQEGVSWAIGVPTAMITCWKLNVELNLIINTWPGISLGDRFALMFFFVTPVGILVGYLVAFLFYKFYDRFLIMYARWSYHRTNRSNEVKNVTR